MHIPSLSLVWYRICAVNASKERKSERAREGARERERERDSERASEREREWSKRGEGEKFY